MDEAAARARREAEAAAAAVHRMRAAQVLVTRLVARYTHAALHACRCTVVISADAVHRQLERYSIAPAPTKAGTCMSAMHHYRRGITLVGERGFERTCA
jgi:hypothetical protein